MEGISVAKRYADGFLEFARDSIGFEKGLEELKALKGVFRDNPDFVTFLESPEIMYCEKCDAVKNILSERFSQEICFFLQLLLKKSRIDRFDDIAEYARFKYAHGEEVDATLEASYPLDTDQLEAIKSLLEKKFSRKIHLYMKLDAGLLGGVRATVGNMVIDGTVKKRLEEMRNKLMAVKVS